jgi:glutamyl-tRNA reductase
LFAGDCEKALESQANQSVLFAIGMNHKTTPVEIRERLYLQGAEIPALLGQLKETLDEAVVVSTCNRIEIYGVSSRNDLGIDYYKDLVIDFKNARGFIRREDFFGLVSCAVCQQLFRVTTSLDSKIVGDMQILGQVRESFQIAEYLESTGKVLQQMFQRSFKVGKQVRTETNLHKGAVSISSAAVEMASKEVGRLADKTVMIVGAGNMARLTAEALLKKKVGRILFANRTRANAEKLMGAFADNDFRGEVLDFETFRERLSEADVVIASTSSNDPILSGSDFADRRTPLLLIDIAVPRDIAPDAGECENIHLRNIDDLTAIIDRNHQRRMADLPLVNQMIMREMSEFLIWYYSQPLLPETRPGAKPDPETQRRIVAVKEFLLKNLPYLHKVALQNGTDFQGHFDLVNELAEMKRAAEQTRFQVAA